MTRGERGPALVERGNVHALRPVTEANGRRPARHQVDRWCLTEADLEKLGLSLGQRKKLMKAQIQKLPLFRAVIESLGKADGQRADESTFLELFALQLPAEDAEAVLKTVIDWGRYAELLGYNPDDREVYLDHGEA